MKAADWRSRLIERPRWHAAVEQRYCQRHPAIRAADRRDRCGEPFCAACLQALERWRVCAACLRQFRQEERADRLPERLRRLRGEIVAGVSIVLVLALVVIGLQALLRSSATNADMLHSAEIVGSKLNGAPAPARQATLQFAGTLSANHSSATIVIAGRDFQAGEDVVVSAEIDGPGALLGPTQRGQDGVTALGTRTVTADHDGAITVQFGVPDAAQLPTPYRLQVKAQGNHRSTGALDNHPDGS